MTQQGFPLKREVALHFHSEFRKARADALRDAEDFDGIMFCLERLGRTLEPKGAGLAAFKAAIVNVARFSPLAEDLPARWADCHTSFSVLYELVRNGRNDAFHQGAVARNLTGHAIAVSLVLEDALMYGSETLGDFMVRDPVCAQLWQPISFLRQTMLVNSFSFLPVLNGDGDNRRWHFVSDHAIAHYPRSIESDKAREQAELRKQALAQPLDVAIASGHIKTIPTDTYTRNTPVGKVINVSKEHPVLVVREGTNELLGIVTAFDLL